MFNFIGGLAILVSLAANGYYVWKDKMNPPCVTQVADQPEVIRIKGGLIEVSVIKSPETFEATRQETVLGVPIGSTITRIRVPAVYRYHAELDSEWKVILKDKTFIVISPPVKPSLPVAVDLEKMEAQASGRWSFFTGGARVDELRRSITKTLAEKASKPSYVQFQRESARKTLKEFVAKWLVTQERWKDASSYPIEVFFADEPIQALKKAPQPFIGAL